MESTPHTRFGSDWDLIQILVDREHVGGAIDLILTYKRGTESKKIQLGGCREHCVEELLDAESVEIYHEASSQREFGQIRLECHGEALAEFFFDTLKEMSNESGE